MTCRDEVALPARFGFGFCRQDFIARVVTRQMMSIGLHTNDLRQIALATLPDTTQ